MKRMFSQDAVHERAFNLLQAVALDDSSLRSPGLAALCPTDCAPVELLDGGRFKAAADAASEKGMWEVPMQTDAPPAYLLQFNHRQTRMVGVINSPLGAASFRDRMGRPPARHTRQRRPLPG
ncbi:hypothetical protein [Stenotrophomonas maltophilia]|uniref:hypothetical protein n=2 Tax=Lysobacteraceae TaxID=32033 RepID=UPI0013A6452C|nr:hypothetical protein [Stenotrophomonas maltophilia]